jgi:hypothetical protein
VRKCNRSRRQLKNKSPGTAAAINAARLRRAASTMLPQMMVSLKTILPGGNVPDTG